MIMINLKENSKKKGMIQTNFKMKITDLKMTMNAPEIEIEEINQMIKKMKNLID